MLFNILFTSSEVPSLNKQVPSIKNSKLNYRVKSHNALSFSSISIVLKPSFLVFTYLYLIFINFVYASFMHLCAS